MWGGVSPADKTLLYNSKILDHGPKLGIKVSSMKLIKYNIYIVACFELREARTMLYKIIMHVDATLAEAMSEE